jgi:hypothetical protein
MQGLLDLSDAQLEDLMLLRQLYGTRRHLLNVKRLELMAGAQEKMAHPVDSVTRMSELATHLQKNASEDHNLLYNMSRAFYCGVSAIARHTQAPKLSWTLCLSGMPGASHLFQELFAGTLPKADTAFTAWQLIFAWPCTTG